MLEQTDFTPVAEGLVAGTATHPELIGSACRRCGTVTFPRQASCPRCTSVDVAEQRLARTGTLWTWTIQCFAPKSPPYAGPTGEDFEPYGVGYAAGGSDAAGNADTSVSVLGLTGVPFINVKNGCATGGSALTTAHAMLSAGSAEVALVVGFDKHPPGAFNPLPEEWGIGSWYGETGLMLTTQIFAMKIQRHMREDGISEATL